MSEPAISVVIPTHRRAHAVRATLAALLRQELDPRAMEVIVVSDGPDPATRATVEGTAADAPWPLRILEQEKAGQGSARNLGIAHARGRLILMLDDDISASPRLLAAHLRAHGRRDDLIVVGALPVERIDPEPAHHRVVREWWESELERMRAPGYVGSFRDFVTGNISVPRARLEVVGGFDRDFTAYGREDYELGYRLTRRGLTVVHAPDAVGVHRYRKPPLDWLRQFRSIGRADVLFARKHPEAVRAIMRLSSLPRLPFTRAGVALGERLVLMSNARGGRAWGTAAAFTQGMYYWRGVRDEARDDDELAWLIDAYEQGRSGTGVAGKAARARAASARARRALPRCVRELGARPLESDAPLVSVVIPSYNHARFLREAIASAQAQTYEPVEVVVVDDGSTDDTTQVALEARVRCLRQPNRGLAAARNAGLLAARGELVVFLDADDRLLPDALEHGVRCFVAGPPPALVAGAYRFIDGLGRFIRPSQKPVVESEHHRHLLESNFIAMHGTVMYRLDLLAAAGGFDETLGACEDYDVYLRLARWLPIRCHEAVVAEYRLHGANMSGDSALMLSTVMRVRDRHRPAADDDAAMHGAYARGRRFYREYYGEQLIPHVGRRVRSGIDRPRAVADFFVLLRHYPSGLWEHARRKLPFTRPSTREAL